MLRSATIVVLLALICAGCVDPEVASTDAPPDVGRDDMPPLLGARIDELRASVSSDPDSADAWGLLGKVFHVHDLNAEATVCYREAARRAPREFRWPYLEVVADEYGQLSDERELALLVRARDLNSQYAPIHLRIGDLLLANDRVVDAAMHYRTARASDPENVWAVLGLARVAMQGERWADARVLLEQARWIEPRHPDTYRLLAIVYTAEGRPELAERATRLAARGRTADFDDPVRDALLDELMDTDSVTDRAESLTRIGEYERAESLLRDVLAVEPDHEDALDALDDLRELLQ